MESYEKLKEQKDILISKKEYYIDTDLSTALYKFALGYKIECRINFSTWEFDFSKNNATVILNQRMIEHGKWSVCSEKQPHQKLV